MHVCMFYGMRMYVHTCLSHDWKLICLKVSFEQPFAWNLLDSMVQGLGEVPEIVAQKKWFEAKLGVELTSIINSFFSERRHLRGNSLLDLGWTLKKAF